MPSQVTIKNVLAGTPWSNDHGTFHPFALTVDVDGAEQVIEVNRKPDSPVLQPGQQVWVETKPGGRNGALRGKVVPPPDQQITFTPGRMSTQQHGDRDESIERQSCVRSAVILYQGTSTAAVDVLATSDLFLQWVQQR